MTSADYTARDVKTLREMTGMGLEACKRAFELAYDPNSGIGGDILWAACMIDAAGLAIYVKGDRLAWDKKHGGGAAERMRERNPALNDLYPVRNTVSVDETTITP